MGSVVLRDAAAFCDVATWGFLCGREGVSTG